MKINELPILYHVAILKALFTKLLHFKLLIWLSLASFHCYSGTQVFEGAQLFVLSMSCCKIKKLHGSSPCWLCQIQGKEELSAGGYGKREATVGFQSKSQARFLVPLPLC